MPASGTLLRGLCLLGCFAALALPAGAAAQDLDSLAVPADTTGRDSAAAYLRLQAEARVRVPVMPRFAAEGPQPPASRLVFPRDSIDWSGAVTVSDLLARVPGVYLWRGGGIGRPEPANYRGRGGASVEYLLDGLPYLPLGPDSIAVDPALFPLGLLDRIEVERWPGQLRVHLYTRRHDRLAAGSEILLGAGPHKLATYRGTLERRFASGFGFGGGAEYLEVPPTGTGGHYQNTQYWAQLSYVPSASFGVQVQYLGATPDRDAFSDGTALGERHEGRRGELQARLFLGGRPGGTGPRLDAIYARSAFDSAGIDQTVAQMGGAASVRGATWALRASALHRTRWTPLDASASASWAPIGPFTLAAEGVYRRHDGSRTARWLGGRVGLGLPGGLSLSGSVRSGDDVPAPALLASAVQEISEMEGTAAWSRGWISAEASYARTKSFAPPGYQPFAGIPGIAPSGLTDWLTLGGHFAPLGWLSVRGWYADSRNGEAEGIPPDHYFATATIRSKFLRRFPSGALDLKLELGVEGWRAGVLGRDPGGAPVALPAARYLRSLVQLQLESFSLFWESRNLTDEPVGYVSGFKVPRYNGVFGIRWGFSN